ncbi:MAG: DDE-type integrase/transposase/recombinase [Betaproteobacteria bacterium]|nr:DDE-type integrase/transposase/recombinase [Betaproteobacteria bacterium]
MNRLSIKDRARILASLCEGVGINATCRLTGASKNTVLKLLAEVGEACALYQDRVMTGLNLKKVQCDEIWSFVGMKERNVPEEHKGIFGLGDVYTWTAIDADTKLVPCWHVGTRGVDSACVFIDDLAKRLEGRVQLTTDGHKAYLTAVEGAFGVDIDFAQLIKLYGNQTATKDEGRRYSPAEVTGIEKRQVTGNPVMKDVSTSFVERANLTMRMHMRRFTRLTNAFSKKLENHMHAISLYFMFYNFCKIHKTLRVTPAMESGISDHLWDLEEVIMMAETMPKNFVTDDSSN